MFLHITLFTHTAKFVCHFDAHDQRALLATTIHIQGFRYLSVKKIIVFQGTVTSLLSVEEQYISGAWRENGKKACYDVEKRLERQVKHSFILFFLLKEKQFPPAHLKHSLLWPLNRVFE